jgi:FKBP-type peptidyl-prolyl cis-trans isomerase FkpA
MGTKTTKSSRSKLKHLGIVILLICTGIASCKDKEVQGDDDATLRNYIANNNLTAEKTPEGLYYIITKEGNGERANIGSTVTVHYKGYKLNGDIFDSSYDRGKTSTFGLTQVIQGWQIGIPKLSVGGTGTLLIPSNLAYGANPPKNSIIGKYEVLAFDIELFEVQ